MTNQHHADARAALEARLLAYDLGAAFTEHDARELAADFITWLDQNGWAPYATPTPRGHHKPADPAKVHAIVEKFKRENPIGDPE